jgi:hypothetical protein
MSMRSPIVWSILSIVFALAAAGLWAWSTSVNVPLLRSGFGGMFTVMQDGSKILSEAPFYAALTTIARLNTGAAACAALSAFAQLGRLLTEDRGRPA